MIDTIKNLPHDAVYTTINSPVGKLCLIASSHGLHLVLWEKETDVVNAVEAWIKEDGDHPVLNRAVVQLMEYFKGKRRHFDIKLAPTGTEFQLKAWRELSKIPYGKTISYSEQAKRVGNPKAVRAIGTANSKNPLSIIVPCHRVIASSGDLAGFGGGIKAKKFLLELESH